MKKKHIIIILVVMAIFLGLFTLMKPVSTTIEPDTNQKEEYSEDKNEQNTKEEIKFLREIAGVKATEIELIKTPVSVKGRFIAPRESILNGVDYFLKDTENSKMKNISIDIGNGYIDLKTDYQINSFITTPIEVKVKPSLDKDKNVVIQVYEFKFLDLKIADWIVNIGVESFIKDWFPKDQNIKVSFEEGKVVIDKSNFDSVSIENLFIDSKAMKIDMIINLEKII